jgi:hypothetical protein
LTRPPAPPEVTLIRAPVLEPSHNGTRYGDDEQAVACDRKCPHGVCSTGRRDRSTVFASRWLSGTQTRWLQARTRWIGTYSPPPDGAPPARGDAARRNRRDPPRDRVGDQSLRGGLPNRVRLRGQVEAGSTTSIRTRSVNAPHDLSYLDVNTTGGWPESGWYCTTTSFGLRTAKAA